MIAFADITQELSYQERFSIPDKNFGAQYSTANKPLFFWYESNESVSSFYAVRVNEKEEITDIVTLNNSLITSDGNTHICDGLTNYSSPLDCGIYYFLVNNKYKSEYFLVNINLTDGTLGHDDIYISGLRFYDNTHTVPWRNRMGHPNIYFGIEFADDTYPLYFDYLSSDAITSFKAVKINHLGNDVEEITLSTSLINVTDHHICTGDIAFSTKLDKCVYYFRVNNKYESELFHVAQITEDYYFELLEGGFLKLLEGGFLKLLS